MNASPGKGRVRWVTAVVIGGGHAGLAVSHCLSARDIDHVVLERGEVANSWRRERWDSLRLLTPNWQSQLPGYHYAGDNPDGFMTMAEVIEFISAYATASAAPVQTHTRVEAVRPCGSGYRVETTRGSWACLALVVASGAFNDPIIPAIDAALPGSIHRLTPHQYRNPAQLAEGGVLVVGAAATGLQIADEVRRSGRPVTLAVGEHVRMPRRYRGRDIQYWMHATGLLDESYRAVDDISRARRLPSSQLVGTPDRVTLDLNTLARRGVQLVGRLAGIQGSTAQFSGALANAARMADLKLNRLLRTIDDWIECNMPCGVMDKSDVPEPTQIETPPRLTMNLSSGEIRTVIWATGFRPDYSWLNVPVLDRKGLIRHEGGVTDCPGLYAMGLPFMRRRKSSFLFGAADDARDISQHLSAFVRTTYRSRQVCVA
jgi:putative flavoprotein involved in K+ transport